MRVALYARFSDEDLQDARSAADQLAMLRQTVAARGWTEVAVFTDLGISGATLSTRPGMQQLLQAAQDGRFDLVMAEALDRIARDQESSAHVFKRLAYRGVALETLSQGRITKMHLGLFGLMDDLFLDELGKKTRRGLIGRVRAGYSGGGRCYGYKVAGKGVFEIDPAEAAVVTRIFEDYASGRSGKWIARALNAEAIPGPRGGTWSPNTIIGDRKAKDGILHQELYIGVRVFNRRRFRKHPDTGARSSVLNPPEQWVREDVPDLRILPDDLWARAQAAIRQYGGTDKVHTVRPKRVLSGLLKCRMCGGNMTLHGGRYTCANARDRGTCDNRKIIAAPTIERRVIDGFRDKLLTPAALDEALKAWRASADEERANAVRNRAPMERELAEVERRLKRATDAYMAGAMELEDFEGVVTPLKARRTALTASLDAVAAPSVIQLHPNALKHYRAMVETLHEALEGDDAQEVRDAMRDLIDRVDFMPRDGMGNFDLTVHAKTAPLFSGAASMVSTASPVLGAVGCGDRI